MLKTIKFSNFRSYYEEQTFSMEAKSEKQYLVENTFEVNKSLFNGRLLKTSMVIGLNAAGKSNLLSVLNYCSYVICQSGKSKGNIFKDADESFLMFESAKNEPKCFEIEFFCENYFYYYLFQIENFVVKYEGLYQRTASKSERLSVLKCLFERSYNNLVKTCDEFNKISEFVEVKSNVLFLSNCNSDIKEDICPNGKRVIKWFQDLNFIASGRASLNIYEENEEYLLKALMILRKSDKSLKKLHVNKRKIEIPLENKDDPNSVMKALKESQVQIGSGFLTMMEDGLYNIDIVASYDSFVNKDCNSIKHNGVQFSIFGSESPISAGQAKLIRYLAFIIMTLDKGGILFIDELDGQLHHQFPKLIVDAFNDPTLNKKNAQLIFSSHSSSLLEKGFRRDQINVVVKDEIGISRIMPLVREGGKRVKNTNSLAKLWINNALNEICIISLEDLRSILLN